MLSGKNILIVSNQILGKFKPNLSPFVLDQVKSIKELGNKVLLIDCNPKNRPFIFALISFIRNLKNTLGQEKPDIVHIQSGGAWGLFTAILAYKYHKIITFHGSDLLFSHKIFFNHKWLNSSLPYYFKNMLIRFFSNLSILLVDCLILVNKQQARKMFFNKKYYILPCGVNMKLFKSMDKSHAKKKLNLDFNKYYVLFINPKRLVKNVKLARVVIEKAKETHTNIELLYAENIPNNKMPIFYNASSLLLITSLSEGSPVMVKESLACNTPIVSVDVGDIHTTLENVENCYVGPSDEDWLVEKVVRIINSNKRVNLREYAKKYSLKNVATDILEIYDKVLISSNSK